MIHLSSSPTARLDHAAAVMPPKGRLRRMRVLFLALVGLSLAAAATARAQNLIRNGGFEVPRNANATWYYVGQSLGRWAVVGDPNGTVQITTKAAQFGGDTLEPKFGKQFLDLTGAYDGGTATGVAQTVPTTPGTSYQLTFWVGNLDYGANPQFGTTSTVAVYSGSSLLMTATNKRGKHISQIAWEEFAINFVATSTETTLSFINGDPAGDVINGLDGVSLVPAAPDGFSASRPRFDP